MDPADLRQMLAEPGETVALADLPARWSRTVIRVRCAGAGDLARRPGLAGQVRGAVGVQLLAMASAPARDGGDCPWRPPCALAVLWHDHGYIAPGRPIPRPYVPAVIADGPDLWVTWTLFGQAGAWAEAVGDALVRGLCAGLSGPGGPRSLVPDQREIVALAGVAVPPVPAAVSVQFEAPVCLRQGRHATGDPGALIGSLVNRVSALARWHGVRVEADRAALVAHPVTIAADGLYPIQWARKAGGAMPMTAREGRIRLSGDLAPLWPLLVLGQTAHAGSRTAQGLGRYILQG